MSSHGITYKIYADDQSPHTLEEWKRADNYINGFSYSRDFNEAVAIARKAAKNCQYPFLVMAVKTGIKDRTMCDVWVIYA